MPIRYPAGIITEHKHTRTAAGLFDVSHMGQVVVSGEHAAAALETLIPVDIVGLRPGRQRYGFLTNESGGILDDVMIANRGEDYLVVVNASRTHEDLNHLTSHIGKLCRIEFLKDRALLALQGPAAAQVLSDIAPAAGAMKFMDAAAIDLAGVRCWASRSGYTGEDGFEISCAADSASDLAASLLGHSEVELIGLGARDSLRLEAGLCLYGNDIDETTSPVEAGLTWAINKARKPGGERAGGYPGEAQITAQLENGAERLRVGLIPRSRIPVRAGAELFDAAENKVGSVTSGSFGPTFDGPVAMGYVETSHATAGTALNALVRGKPVPVEVSKMPAVAHRYRR